MAKAKVVVTIEQAERDKLTRMDRHAWHVSRRSWIPAANGRWQARV